MEISFQHTNHAASHDSTLLTVSPPDKEPYRYLIDAGESVSPSAFLGAGESLDGVFLTHAHNDHYTSLAQILSDSETPLFTSPPTATILEQVYAEANRYQDLGDVETITEALTPIDQWTSLADEVDVVPLPAGHTPGAAAFLFRIDDLERNDETVTILATGDFTIRPVAGYSGLSVPESIDIDVLIANAATSEEFSERLSEAIEMSLERALSGATTLVAAGALTGVHVAYVMGHLADRLDRRLPIHLVGQAAKLYDSLAYDVPAVVTHPQFEHTDAVLEPGGITIAGPEAPTHGSVRRLFGVIEEDPSAMFVQLTTSSPELIERGACATYHVQFSNHPSENKFKNFVTDNLPRHLIFKHVQSERAAALGSSLSQLFYWKNHDMKSHVLYSDGDWPAPTWMNERKADLIRRRNYRQSDMRIPIDRPVEDLPSPSWERQTSTLQAEGVAVDSLIEQFGAITPPESASAATSDGGQARTDAQTGGDPTTKPAGSSSDQNFDVDPEFQTTVVDRLEAIESTLEDLSTATSSAETVESEFESVGEQLSKGFDSVGARLENVEAKLETLPEDIARHDFETVTGTVLKQNDLVLIRVDADEVEAIEQQLHHEEEINIWVRSQE